MLFHKFMMEKYAGGSAGALRDVLTAYGSNFTATGAINSVLSSYSSDIDDAMKHFALWNFFTGARTSVMNSYGDASLMDTFTHFQDVHFMSNSSPTVPARNVGIPQLGAHYYQFRPDPSLTSQRKLTIKVTGDSFNRVKGWLVIRRQNGTTESRDLNLGPGGFAVSQQVINDFSYSTVGEAVLILATGFDGVQPLTVTYEANLNFAIDMAFAMDTTGSMSGSISAIKSTATSAMTTLGSNGADFRIAVTEFKDFPNYPYGGAGDFPYRPDSPFSNQPSVILGGLNMLVASGGGDWPESQLSGIMGCINAQGIGAWRNDAKKAIVVMTDAPPHNPEPYTGYTTASVAAAANAGGIVVASNPPRLSSMSVSGVQSIVRLNPAPAASSLPIHIYGIVIGGDSEAYAALSQLANATGGKVFTATYNINDIINALTEAIGDIGGGGEEPPPPPANHAPDVSAAIANPSALWQPNGKMVPIAITNVTDADGDSFTIRITAITQDEPVNGKNQGNADPDGAGVGTSSASIRSERDGDGNGRTYKITFTATDSRGASSTGSVTVCVPHDQGRNDTCSDDGQLFDSTKP